MNILIVGGSGFIGRHLYRVLSQKGHKLSGCSRYPVPNTVWHQFSFDQSQKEWEAQLQNIDIVINTVGIYQESQQGSFSQIHDLGPKVLFDTCQKLNINVLQLSAIGAEQDNPVTEFLQSKRNADQYLLALSGPHVVLYPGIVLGEGGKTTEQLSLVVHFYCMPLVFGRQKELPLISIYQLTSYVSKIINHWPKRGRAVTLIARPETMEHLLTNLRHWLGMGKGYFFVLPKLLLNRIFYFFPSLSVGAFNKQSLTMLSAYSNTKVSLDRNNRPEINETASDSLLKQKATREYKKTLQLKLIFYFNLFSLGIIWIVSGLSSLLSFEQSRELIALIGIDGSFGDGIISIAAWGDIFLGLFLWIGFWYSRLLPWVIYAQLGIMLIYSLIITIAAPIFWLHPFAPIVKNLAMLVMALYLLIEIKK